MKPFPRYFSNPDRVLVARLLRREEGASARDTADRAVEFLRSSTWVSSETGEAFAREPSGLRERILSELLWRILCFLDGSVTTALDQPVLPLEEGYGLSVEEREGRSIFLIHRVR